MKHIDELVLNRKVHCDELINYMPYSDKVLWAKNKIKEFLNFCMDHNEKNDMKKIDEITVSFSGGKDSTVLLDLVLKVHKEINCNISIVPCYAIEITFPSTIKFINELIDHYRNEYPFLKEPLMFNPKMPWNLILEKKGYPIYSKQTSVLINRVKNAKTQNSLTKWFFGVDIKNTNTAKYRLSKNRIFLLDDYLKVNWPKLDNESQIKYFKKYNEFYFYSEKCCDFVKGGLKHDSRPSFIGVMAEESQMRRKSWIASGCNVFNRHALKSRPLSIWKSEDIWKYIVEEKLMINPAYGYNTEKPLFEQRLHFQRLGCTSCPFGSSIEQRRIEVLKKNTKYKDDDVRLKNRFEILKDYYPALYKAQVINTGMYRILIDMNIHIFNDEQYMQLYEKRWNQIKDWYSDAKYRINILRVMAQLENINDYKRKGSSYVWNYTIAQINEGLSFFGFNNKTNLLEFNAIRENEHLLYKFIHDNFLI